MARTLQLKVVSVLLMGFLNEDMMAAHIGGHALAWYAVVFGLILTLIILVQLIL